jgi:hypothetical protein
MRHEFDKQLNDDLQGEIDVLGEKLHNKAHTSCLGIETDTGGEDQQSQCVRFDSL